jgi:hypothetical protein
MAYRQMTRAFAMSAGAVCILALTAVASDPTDLSFHRVTRNATTYARSSEQYEPLEGNRYVERTPALAIPIALVTQLSIERRTVHASVERALKDELGQSTIPKPTPDTRFTYVATVTLNPTAAAMFKPFAAKNEGGLLEVRLAGKRLALVTLVGPFEGTRFTTTLVEQDADRIKAIVAPLKDRVTWH